jgi:hypothetical protein
MSIQKIIQESINGNPLEMKESLAEELRDRIRLALEAKMDEDMSEEVEQIDELKKSTLASYISKASDNAASHAIKYGEKKAQSDEMDRMMNRHMSYDDKDKMRSIMKTTNKDVNEPREKAAKRLYGISRAAKKLAKEEFDISDLTLEELEDFMESAEFDQLDEISKGTLASYVKKASQSAADNAEKSGKHYEKSTNASDIDTADRYFDSYVAKGAKSIRRLKGISKATDRLAK